MRKHETIETWIKNRINEGVLVPGEKLPSESQLCAQFGVSRNAVRKALRTLALEGVVQTTKGVGTFCRTRLPVSFLSSNIGIVEFFISSYIYPEVIRGCYNTLSRRGFALLVNQSEYNLERERFDPARSAQEEGGRDHHRADLRGGRPLQRAPPGRKFRTRAPRWSSATTISPAKLQQRNPRLPGDAARKRRPTYGRTDPGRSGSSIKRTSS